MAGEPCAVPLTPRLFSVSARDYELSLEASKFHDEDDGLAGSGWQQYSIGFTYLLSGGRESLFRGVRSVDYFYD